jgi:Domain of unknown function (DUF4365)
MALACRSGAAQLDLNAQKDHFSRAVVRAIAAAAGAGATVPELDQNSEDIEFTAPDTADGPGPKLGGQLKCSQNIEPTGETFPYDLPIKNYRELRWPANSLYVPRILVLVHVPPNPEDWFSCDPVQIVMRRCAYWMSLAGQPIVDNAATVRVHVPTAQIFNVEALRENLKRPGEGL